MLNPASMSSIPCRKKSFLLFYTWTFLVITTAGRIFDPMKGLTYIFEYRYLFLFGYALFAFVFSLFAIFLSEKLGRAAIVILLMAMMLCFVLSFFLIYPRVGMGSNGFGDADDALDLIAGSLLSGRNPYESKTYLGNVISPLPGAGIIALPFYLIFGSSAFQNPFWLICGIYTVYRRSSPKSAFVSAMILLGSPGFLNHYLTGHDYYTSAIYLCLASAWVFHEISAPKSTPARLTLSTCVFMLACNSRILTVPIILVVFIYMIKKKGFIRSLPPLFTGGLLWVCLLYPYFMAPDAFSPIRTGGIAGSLIIQSAIIFISIGIIVGWAFGLWPNRWRKTVSQSKDSPANGAVPWLLILCLSLCFIPVLISRPFQIARATFFLIAGSPAVLRVLQEDQVRRI